MKRGKYEHGYSKKALALLVAVVLVIGCAVGGTLAWLMDTTDPVTNTFTVGDIALTLKESPYTPETGEYGEPEEKVNNRYPLIPGNSYKKDPVVTVAANSEACYLFVKVEQDNSPSDYLTYTLKLDGWTPLTGWDGVYYRNVAKSPSDQSWELLDNNTIAVKESVTKENMNTAAQAKLTFTAYAVQQANRSVEQAWDLVK